MPNDGSLETEINYGYGLIVFCNFHRKVAGEKGFDSRGRKTQQDTGNSNGELKDEGAGRGIVSAE
jgi:hypothetical protein